MLFPIVLSSRIFLTKIIALGFCFRFYKMMFSYYAQKNRHRIYLFLLKLAVQFPICLVTALDTK